MSSHYPPSRLSRRRVLKLLLSSGLGYGLAGCGGSSGDSAQARITAVLKAQADAAVASGLVGLTLGEVSHVPGCTVAISGKRRIGGSKAVTPDDRFAIGSNTKAMTCAAIVGLAQRRGPLLSQTLPQVFAEWASEIHPAFTQVTLIDLLHHRGGLPPYNGSGPEEDAFLATVDADTGGQPTTMMGRRAYFARWLLAQPPATGVTPGRDYLYSNAGYVLAAAMIEAQTSRAFEDVFDEVLVKPLGLEGVWRSPVPGERDVLWGHEGTASALAVVEATAESLATKDWLDIMAPAGHWACTGAAYGHWLEWHVRALRGELTPLPQVYVDDLRAAKGGRYAWGWLGLATPNRVLLMHTGHEPGFMAEAVMDNKGGFALFGLSNTAYFADDGSSWVLSLIDKALAEVLKQQSIAL